MTKLTLVVDNDTTVKGRKTKRKALFTGMQLVVNEPMGFQFLDAKRSAAERKTKQAEQMGHKNRTIVAELSKR